LSTTPRLGGGWVKEKFTLFGEPNYDAKENPDSKINTFTGWCEFSLLRGITKFHTDKSSAQRDSNFTQQSIIYHRHNYVYRNQIWVAIKREHRTDGMVKIDLTDWYDCNELITTGENKGQTNLEGCWE